VPAHRCRYSYSYRYRYRNPTNDLHQVPVWDADASASRSRTWTSSLTGAALPKDEKLPSRRLQTTGVLIMINVNNSAWHTNAIKGLQLQLSCESGPRTGLDRQGPGNRGTEPPRGREPEPDLANIRISSSLPAKCASIYVPLVGHVCVCDRDIKAKLVTHT